MRKLFKSEQSGRSMVEMLGVLAIVGVLSVAGISGYSKAMAKFKITKTTDQVSTLVANIRTIFAGQRNYADLTDQVAIDIGSVPEDMVNAARDGINNAFNGEVHVNAVNTNFDDGGFVVAYTNLSRDACATLATSDWGSGSTSGLLVIEVSNAAYAAKAAVPAGNVAGGIYDAPNNLPVTPAQASASCGDANVIYWYYF